MGVINIRPASVGLQNLGTPTRPHFGDGGQAYWESVGRSAQGLVGAAAHAVSSIAASIAAERSRRDERTVSDALAEYQASNAEHERTLSAGQVGDDENAWISSNVEWRDTEKRRIVKERGLKDDALAEFNRRSAPLDIATQNGWTRRAVSVRNDRAVGTANANLETSLAVAAMTDAELPAWIELERSVDASIAAQEQREGRAFSEDERKAFRRKVGDRALERSFANALEETERLADEKGEEGADVFDARIRLVRENDADRMLPAEAWLPDDGETGGRNILGSMLGDANRESFRKAAVKDLERAKASWQRKQRAMREELERAASDNALEKEILLHRTDVPEGPAAKGVYLSQLSEGYLEMSEDKALPPERRRAYRMASERYAEEARSIERSSMASARNEAEKQLDERRERAFELDYADLVDLGVWRDENGRRVHVDAAQIRRIAERGLADGTYSTSQFHRLLTASRREWDDENAVLRDHVLSVIGSATPRIAYRQQDDAFAFDPASKTETDAKKSGITFSLGRRRQEATYREVIRAMNLALDWRKANGKSVNDAVDYFDNLVRGTLRVQQRATISECLDFDERLEKRISERNGL